MVTAKLTSQNLPPASHGKSGMMGGVPRGLLTSHKLSPRSHHAVEEFTRNPKIGNNLFLRFPSPMPSNNLGIKIILKFPSLKLTT
jgi:hypothetical protein